MERKIDLSTGLLALGVIGNLFSIVSGAEDMINLLGLISFPVSFLYHFMIAFGVTGFISMYLDHRRKAKKIKAERQNHLAQIEKESERDKGDCLLKSSIYYIRTYTTFGQSLEEKRSNIFIAKSVYKAFKDKKLRLFGIKQGQVFCQRIDPDEIKGYEFISEKDIYNPVVKDIRLRIKDSEGFYSNITLLEKEINFIYK